MRRNSLSVLAGAVAASLFLASPLPLAAQSDEVDIQTLLEDMQRLENLVNPWLTPQSDCPKIRPQIRYCGDPEDWVEIKLPDGNVMPDYLRNPRTGILARIEQVDLPEDHDLTWDSAGAILRGELARFFNVAPENTQYFGSQPKLIRDTVFTVMHFSLEVSPQEKQYWLVSYYLAPTRFFWIGNIQVTAADGEATELLGEVHYNLMDTLQVEWLN